jgi:hypothetical protein
MTTTKQEIYNWEQITPQVNGEAEFWEIVHDFGDPLEILREAISNAMDARATWIKISFNVEEIAGNRRCVVTLSDNGEGMTREVLGRDFWGLGYSRSRENKDLIGEKGHGTKIYLRAESVAVRTQSIAGSFFSECDRPLSNLAKNILHQPRISPIDTPFDHPGTEIRIVGYNDNERSRFVQNVVKDYIYWFTKAGSCEKIFGITKNENFKVFLKCVDQDHFEEIGYGHPFPAENSDIDKLFHDKGPAAADWYVKRYIWKGQRLANHPEVTFDAIISVEGDAVKRSYNPMAGERRRAGTGRYRMSDRYGIWLCRDFIPVSRVNDWISGFGSGSNAFVLLHGFVNCQSLKLTANRGDIANTDPLILQELRSAVQPLLDHVDKELDEKGIYTLREWQEESRTLQQEKTEFSRRIKSFKTRKVAKLGDILLLEPTNEAELSKLFITIHALHPELFEFEPLDYNANKGIDIIARNKGDNSVTEAANWYIELKHILQQKRFNHAFEYLRWIICWDFVNDALIGSDLQGIEDLDVRQLQVAMDGNGFPVYFLDSKSKARKVQVIRLKEFLKNALSLEFETQKT